MEAFEQQLKENAKEPEKLRVEKINVSVAKQEKLASIVKEAYDEVVEDIGDGDGFLTDFVLELVLPSIKESWFEGRASISVRSEEEELIKKYTRYMEDTSIEKKFMQKRLITFKDLVKQKIEADDGLTIKLIINSPFSLMPPFDFKAYNKNKNKKKK